MPLVFNQLIMSYEIEFITPKMAAEYFEKNDPENRPLDLRKVELYKREMEEGKWKLRDSIGFSYYTGYLINGQHRMKALSMANITGERFRVIRNA